jgi:hypothetical protein
LLVDVIVMEMEIEMEMSPGAKQPLAPTDKLLSWPVLELRDTKAMSKKR